MSSLTRKQVPKTGIVDAVGGKERHTDEWVQESS